MNLKFVKNVIMTVFDFNFDFFDSFELIEYFDDDFSYFETIKNLLIKKKLTVVNFASYLRFLKFNIILDIS